MRPTQTAQAKLYTIQTRTYPLYTSPNDPLPISSNELNLDPAASIKPAASSILMH